MKKCFSLILSLLCILVTQAADVIVLRNSTRIDAKILEVSDTEIKYKKVNNLNGPTFTQKVEGISAIIYENGDVTSYADQAPTQQASTQTQSKPQSNNVSNTSANQAADEKKESNFKLQFNPQPSDKYWFGLTIGYVSKNMKATAYGESATGSFIFAGRSEKTVTPAMRLGLTMNPTFKYGIGLRTGLFFEYGIESLPEAAETPSGDIADVVGHDIGLSVPLQLSYRYELIPKLSLMLYTGPIFDFGMARIVSYPGSEPENIYGYDISSGKQGYSGFNCLWGIGAGIQWDHLRLDIGGDFGMVNKYTSEGSAKLNWNKPVYVTLTWLF